MIENQTKLIQHTLQNILKVLQKESANVSNLVFRQELKYVIKNASLLKDYCNDFISICNDIEKQQTE